MCTQWFSLNKKFKRQLRLLTLTVFVFSACSGNNGVSPNEDLALTPDNDVAGSLASALGQENGGAMDQLNDLAALANTGIQTLAKASTSVIIQGVEAEYDSATGTWTATVSKERGDPAGEFYASFERVYTYQFLNKDGQAQKFYVTDGDTAYSINFDIVSGSGIFNSPNRMHELTGLGGSFVATDTQTDIVTINGTYTRSAVDTVSGERGTRSLSTNIDLNFMDITVPRENTGDISDSISGTITGTFQADISFLQGEEYRERSIERDINIDLEDGEARIRFRGLRFIARLFSGDVTGR